MKKLIIITADNHRDAIEWYHLNLSQFKDYLAENMSDFNLKPILTHQAFIDEAQNIAKSYKNGLVYFMFQDDLLREVYNLTIAHKLSKRGRELLEKEDGIVIEHTIDINDITLVDIVNGVATIGDYGDDNQLDRLIMDSNTRSHNFHYYGDIKDEQPYIIDEIFIDQVVRGIGNYYRHIGETLPEIAQLHENKQMVMGNQVNDVFKAKLLKSEIPIDIIKYGFADACNWLISNYREENYIKPTLNEFLQVINSK